MSFNLCQRLEILNLPKLKFILQQTCVFLFGAFGLCFASEFQIDRPLFQRRLPHTRGTEPCTQSFARKEPIPV